MSALGTRIRLSDPKPAFCAACYASPDEATRFVDFDAAYDAGTVINGDAGGIVTSIDDLHLCENCVRQAVEALGLKPTVHVNQLREIGRLETENRHWRDYAKRLEATLNDRPEPATIKKRVAR